MGEDFLNFFDMLACSGSRVFKLILHTQCLIFFKTNLMIWHQFNLIKVW